MNTEIIKGLVVLAFLALGTGIIAGVMTWAIRHLGPPKHRPRDGSLFRSNSAKQPTKGTT
jgi:hypothetical protein